MGSFKYQVLATEGFGNAAESTTMTISWAAGKWSTKKRYQTARSNYRTLFEEFGPRSIHLLKFRESIILVLNYKKQPWLSLTAVFLLRRMHLPATKKLTKYPRYCSTHLYSTLEQSKRTAKQTKVFTVRPTQLSLLVPVSITVPQTTRFRKFQCL